MWLGTTKTNHPPRHLIGDSSGPVVPSQTATGDLWSQHHRITAPRKVLSYRNRVEDGEHKVLQPSRVIVAQVVLRYSITIHNFFLTKLRRLQHHPIFRVADPPHLHPA